MFKSSPVAEGRLPRLMEFLVAFLLLVLRLTLAVFPSSDFPGVTLSVLRLSKAERDCVEPWVLPWLLIPLCVTEATVLAELRSKVEFTRLWY